MKKSISLLCCILFLLVGANAQISIGPMLGVNSTKWHFAGPGVITSSYTKNRFLIDFRVGALADVPLTGKWHLQPGLIYSRNSYNNNSTSVAGGGGGGFRLYAAEIPVNIMYKTQQKNGGHFLFSAGPYFAVNTNGTAHVIYTDIMGNVIKEDDVPLTIGKSGVGGFRRLVGGVGANAGYELKGGFSARLHFQKDILNQLAPPNTARATNYNYGITFAYMFPLKKDKTKKKK